MMKYSIMSYFKICNILFIYGLLKMVNGKW